MAEAIAEAIAVPLFVVRYEAMIGSYLGETAARLKRVFDYARTTPCVLFFDEFDAIGKERGDIHETGEIKRVVTSLLMQFDDLPSYTILAGATNIGPQIGAMRPPPKGIPHLGVPGAASRSDSGSVYGGASRADRPPVTDRLLASYVGGAQFGDARATAPARSSSGHAHDENGPRRPPAPTRRMYQKTKSANV